MKPTLIVREGARRVDTDEPLVTAEGTCNLFALVVGLVGLLTIAFLGAFLIGVGYAVWPVLVAALS
jgi:hypothetical protein